jgi:hypothetical protein
MHTILSRQHPMHRLASLWFASAMLSLSAAAAAGTVAPSDAQARYEQERARCLSGESGQAQSTCLKEAGAALDAAKHGQLNDGNANYRQNAKERCSALTGDEMRDCIARAKGQSTSVSGSVKGGGILRESVTVETRPALVIVPAVPAASAP